MVKHGALYDGEALGPHEYGKKAMDTVERNEMLDTMAAKALAAAAGIPDAIVQHGIADRIGHAA